MKLSKQFIKELIQEAMAGGRDSDVLEENETEDKYVFDDDALKRWPNAADRKEMCNNKSNRGEKVQWVVRNGKGRCEKAS